MDSKVVWIRDVDVVSPVIPETSSFEDVLYNMKENFVSEVKIDLNKSLRQHFKVCRRMNQTAKLGFLSATNVMNKSGILNVEFDKNRFGTAISSTNASYDSVLRILKTLYSKGLEEISPIDFTYSVGNSMLSGITMSYQLLGPSNVLPSSEALQVAHSIIEQNDADYMLVSSVNICTDENFDYYHQFDYLQGDASGQNNGKMTIREQAVSIILEREDSKHNDASCYFENIVQMRKSKRNRQECKTCDSAYDVNTMYELAGFEKEDFSRVMIKALNETPCDVVLLCSAGYKEMKDAELGAIHEVAPNAVTLNPGEIFGSNFGSSFMLNVAVAVSILRKQSIPGNSNNKNIKRILVNGYNELGNIISGVVACI